MNLKPYLLLVCCLGLFSSCSHFYNPALFHQDIAYQPKPASFDTTRSATYISGGLKLNTNEHLDDFLYGGQVNISRGHVFKNFNIAYGAFGSFGDYQNSAIEKGDPHYFTDKFFGALGGRFSANAFITSGRADIRFIGLEAAYSHEFGGYANFRRGLNTQPDYFADPRTDLFTLGLTTEVIFHNQNNKSIQHGIRGFFGGTFGHNPFDGNPDYNYTEIGAQISTKFFPKASYFINIRNFMGTIEVGNEFFLRFGYKF